MSFRESPEEYEGNEMNESTKLKSAEEWIKETTPTGIPNPKVGMFLAKDVEAIQHNALLFAAEIASSQIKFMLKGNSSQRDELIKAAARVYHRAILSEANKLLPSTEKEKE